MPFSALNTLNKLYVDALRSFIFNHRFNCALIATIVVFGVIISALAPLAIAKIISSISEQQDNKHDVGYYIVAFIALKFIGQGMIDLRWRAINPLLYCKRSMNPTFQALI